MKWEILSKADAKAATAEWNSMNHDDFLQLRSEWSTRLNLSQEYRSLRNDLTKAWNQANQTVANGSFRKTQRLYAIDLLYAVQIYKIMNSRGFTPRLASNDNIWIYLSIKVIPDIISFRFNEKTDKETGGVININEARYWKERRRIYPKTLWWYIHLSLLDGINLDDSLNKTYSLLKNHTTDTVVQLVERSGHNGYRIDVYREIMRYYSGVSGSMDNRTDLFRKVMVLNTARTTTVEPDLCDGGTKGYVRDLFEYFGY